MTQLLRDLYLHQSWADAELWNALEAHPGAVAYEVIAKRAHHIHFVQHAYLWVVEGKSGRFTGTTPSDFKTPGELKHYAREYHERMIVLLDRMGEARLGDQLTIPWFRQPALTVTLEEALTQTVMHSHYHRGQNAARLHELGGNPPLTDFIAWLWKSRPKPAWSKQ
jgi:uncharacterized damage-inducible protein DinB